jgi:RHS repeat-associated protein
LKFLIILLSFFSCFVVTASHPTVFKYDEFGNLACEYVKFDAFYKTPDAVGNLYKSRDQDDRKYGKGGKLLQDDKHFYKYDNEGNLILKSTRNINQPLTFAPPANWMDKLIGNKTEETKLQAEHQEWQQGDTAYNWLANGMLASVTNEDGTTVKFEYDALGRRTAKLVIPPLGARGLIYRYFWDGNVLLHEWKYELKQRPKLTIDKEGELSYNAKEPIENLVTWVYEEGSFAPSAKIVANETFSIINDYIGRPIQCYNESGNIVWETDYDIYGQLRNFSSPPSEGLGEDFIPFRQLGQYEDVETGLYYNRFRYYNPESGLYLSQDPIGLDGENPNFYGYVFDSNSEVDIFGLAGMPWHHLIPQEMMKNPDFMRQLNQITGGKAKDYINRQGSIITKKLHQAIHKGAGGGLWNDAFNEWFEDLNDSGSKMTKKNIQSQLKKMMKDFNLPKSSRNFARKYKRKTKTKFKCKS